MVTLIPRSTPRDEWATGAAGFALAAGALLRGFYDLQDWGPIAICALLAAGAVIVRGARLTGLCAAAAGCLAALAAWAQLSLLWAESVDRALVDASRWALYAAVFLLLVVLARPPRRAQALLCGLAVGIFAVSLVDLGALLMGATEGRFFERRLQAPLDYANAQAAYFLLGLWSAVALAERARTLWASAAGTGLAVMLAGLALLTESRASLPAIVAAAAIALLLPGRTRRAVVMLLVGVAVAAVAPRLLDVAGRSDVDVPVSAVEARSAALALAFAAVGAAATWVTFKASVCRLGRHRPMAVEGVRRAFVVGLGVLLAMTVGLLTLRTGEISAAVHEQVDAFVDLRPQADRGDRLLTGAGNRYDYWRVALEEAGDRPLAGVGAGNYPIEYYLRRRTQENVTQPHSLSLQVVAELGVVGLLLVGGWVTAIGVAFGRRLRRARDRPNSVWVTLAAAPALAGWLVHAQLDWLHLFPELTAVALTYGAVLLGTLDDLPDGRALPSARTSRWWAAARVVAAAAIFIGAIQAARVTFADAARDDARRVLAASPSLALERVDTALVLNGASVEARFVQAAAEERLGRFEAAREALVAATRSEPRNHVTWALLGDLALRRGNLDFARRSYRRAADLNPQDPGLRSLADGPASLPQGRR
jgi:O-antigen ligase